MDRLDVLLEEIDTFLAERDWYKFNSPANLSKTISIEAGELLECFQWNEKDIDLEATKEEIGDVISNSIQLCFALKVDPKEAMETYLSLNDGFSKSKKSDRVLAMEEEAVPLEEISLASYAIRIVVGAGRLLEIFQWDEISYNRNKAIERIGHLIALSVSFCEKLGFSFDTLTHEKILLTKEKYPVDKCKGVSTKYTEL